jgi:hypothetical protein
VEDDTPRRLEYMDLEALQPHPDNPKAHDIPGIGKSMGKFGVVDPIVVDERTGLLISGHGRVESFRGLRDAGDTPPEGVTVAADGTWTVPVVRGWASKDDDEARAALVGLNQGTIAGGWVPDKLAMLLDDLAQNEDGLTGTFFTADDVDSLLADVGAGELPPGESDAAYAPDPPPSHPGDNAGGRVSQGLHEIGLFYGSDDHREFLRLIAVLGKRYDEDARPLVVLRALQEVEQLTEQTP